MTFRRHILLGAAVVAAFALGTPEAMAAGGSPQATPSAPSTQEATVRPLGPLGSLTDLVIQRLLVSDQVAAAKFGTDSPIDAPAREQQELDEVRRQAGTLGLDPDATVAFFQDQITASKVVQRGLFARWTAHPDQAPTTHPDLTQIRTQLDRLTTELLQELTTTEKLRSHPVDCTVHLTLATLSGAVFDRLDTLHRQALTTATQSVCSGPQR
jgi:chorismate mutase